MTPPFARHRDVLDNDLRVVTVEMPHLHSATIVMYARVGSRYEDERDNGLSHFLEHMLFRGTARYPDAYRLNYAIEALGGTLYAETGRDYSLYQLSLHPDTLADGIAMFGEIFRAPVFEGIDVERRIILEEILEDLDEDGKDVNIDDVARAAAFPGHPLGYKITGPYANVERFTTQDVRRHFARCYGARNMVLAVSGATRRDDVIARVRSEMGGLPSGAVLESPAPREMSDGPRYVHVHNTGSQTATQILFRALPETHPDHAAQIVLARILDDGMSTRLHHRVCDELGLAYYVSGGVDSFNDSALFEIDGNSAHANVPALVEESLSILARLRDQPASAEELDKARRRYRWDLESSFDEPDAMAGWWGGGELYVTPLGYDDKIARIERVGAEDVMRAARAIFRRERLTVATVGQLGGGLEDRVRKLLQRFA